MVTSSRRQRPARQTLKAGQDINVESQITFFKAFSFVLIVGMPSSRLAPIARTADMKEVVLPILRVWLVGWLLGWCRVEWLLCLG